MVDSWLIIVIFLLLLLSFIGSRPGYWLTKELSTKAVEAPRIFLKSIDRYRVNYIIIAIDARIMLVVHVVLGVFI